jgi:hypothetical protein
MGAAPGAGGSSWLYPAEVCTSYIHYWAEPETIIEFAIVMASIAAGAVAS